MAESDRAIILQVLGELVDGVGDVSRQRLFRMNVGMCLHRAATGAEVATAPEWFHTSSACGLAGGPVEVLWENVPGRPSTKPCEQPTRVTVIPGRPDLWVPVDCEQCGPCRARAEVPSYVRPARPAERIAR